VLFADAWRIHEEQSVSLIRRNRKGGCLIIKSRIQAYERMGMDDYLADNWEIYRKLNVPVSKKRWWG
jgi:hypothetical protein